MKGAGTMENLGAIIKAARLEAGMTRKALADKTGVSVRHLKYIENNQRKPSLSLLYRLIRELDIPADKIFHPERAATPSPEKPE